MSSFNQNSILAHRSIYGNQSQSSSSSLTEYKIVSFRKEPPTPRRLMNQKKSNNIDYLSEKSRLLLEIAILRDEISELNKILDEKKKGFSNSELTNIFYFNKYPKPLNTTTSIYQESATLDKKIEDLTEIFDSDSIERLNESNENNKNLLHKEQEAFENKKEQTQIIQEKIKKIRDSDIYREIFEQRKKIKEKHDQIRTAVEIHRKLKEKLRKMEGPNQAGIQELENTLTKAQDNKKKAVKKYKNIRKQQQKERIEAETEKLRRSKKFVISTVLQSFELSVNQVDHDHEDSIQKSIVSFEKPINETESETKNTSGSNPIINQPKSKKYIQENGILIDSDFEIATQLLSENEEEECNQNKLEEEEENEIIIPHKPLIKKVDSKNKQDHQENIVKDMSRIKTEKEKIDQEVIDINQPKVELVHNSIQCEINIDDNEERINNNNENDSSPNKNEAKYQVENNTPSFLFPPESEIESTSIIYSESDFSSSQIEAMKKERKMEQKEIQSKILLNDDQISTEIELDEKMVRDSSVDSNSDLDNINESRIDLQSESTSIYNSSIDSEKMIQNDVSSETTSIATSASDFKFTDIQESFLNREAKLKKASQKMKVDAAVFPNGIDPQVKAKSYIKKEKGTMTANEANDVTSSGAVNLEPSKPISFESPEILSQPQISTGGNSEYTEYLSSQLSEDESDVEIKTNLNERSFSSNSFNSDRIENSSMKSPKSNLTMASAPKNEKKMFFHSPKSSIQNNFIEYNSSISSSRKKVVGKELNKIVINNDLLSSSLDAEQVMIDHNNDNYSSSCQSAALMSASDNSEVNIIDNQNLNDKTELYKNLKRPIPPLNSRRIKKCSDQDGINDNNDDDVLDNKFIVKDDRKILKIGSFTIKPSKKEIMPYFARFGTVNSYVVHQDQSKYFVYIGFKKHSAAKNAKKNLNGSKVAGTRLKITLESESLNEPNFNFKCSKNQQSTKPKDTTIYEDLLSPSSS